MFSSESSRSLGPTLSVHSTSPYTSQSLLSSSIFDSLSIVNYGVLEEVKVGDGDEKDRETVPEKLFV